MNEISEKLIKIRYYNRPIKKIKNLVKWIINKIGSVLFFYLKKDFDVPYDRVKRILLISLYYRGDVLFHTTVIKLLKHIFINAEIDVWVKSRSKEILEHNKDVNRVISFDHIKTDERFEPFNINFGSKLKFLRELKMNKYDIVIDFTGLFATSLFSYLINPLFSVGKFEQGFGFLYNKYFDLNLSKTEGHLVLKYMNLIRAAFNISDDKWLELTNVVLPRGTIYLEDYHVKEIEKILISRGIDIEKPIVCIHLTAGWEAKRWDLENYSSLIEKLILNYGYEIAIVGNKFDSDEYTKIILKIQHLIYDKNLSNRFFELPVLMNAALIKRSNVFIGSDSLPLHIAGAVQTPSIGLFGPTNPEFSKPLGNKHQVCYHKLFCSSGDDQQYCTRNAGRTCNTLDCMKLISVDDVLDKIDKLIHSSK